MPRSTAQARIKFVTAAGLCWLLLAAAAVTDMLRWNGTKWTRVATPNPGGSTKRLGNGPLNELDGVACGSPASCWAVGNYWDYAGGTRLSIALHWNGTSWSNG